MFCMGAMGPGWQTGSPGHLRLTLVMTEHLSPSEAAGEHFLLGVH